MSAAPQAGDGGAGFELEALATAHAVCLLEPGAAIPEWTRQEPGAILSITRSDQELSIVCADHLPPSGVQRSEGWRAIRVAGILDHGLTGVLVSLAAPLAEAGVPIFAISSHRTDYLLVRDPDLGRAIAALESAGHRLRR